MRIRIPFAPWPTARAALNVLISHRSTEFERAKAFSRRLSSLGFTVRLLEPDSLSPRSDEELARLLADVVLDTDVCCVMVSAASASSDWVRFEYQEAAAVFGRVIFLVERPPDGDLDFGRRSSFARPSCATLQVKHSILSETAPDDALLVELCNDPDEGWFDGSESYGPDPRRVLKAESEIRKFVRSSLMCDQRYAGRTIVDVLPFSWSQSPTRDRDEIFRWLLNARGRGDLLRSLGEGVVEGFLASYLATHVPSVATVLGADDGGFAHALVFTLPAA
jgi:hypothetical protein